MDSQGKLIEWACSHCSCRQNVYHTGAFYRQYNGGGSTCESGVETTKQIRKRYLGIFALAKEHGEEVGATFMFTQKSNIYAEMYDKKIAAQK